MATPNSFGVSTNLRMDIVRQQQLGASLRTPADDATYRPQCLELDHHLLLQTNAHVQSESGWSAEGALNFFVSRDEEQSDTVDVLGTLTLDSVPQDWVDDLMEPEFGFVSVDRAFISTVAPVNVTPTRNPVSALEWQGSATGESETARKSTLLYEWDAR